MRTHCPICKLELSVTTDLAECRRNKKPHYRYYLSGNYMFEEGYYNNYYFVNYSDKPSFIYKAIRIDNLIPKTKIATSYINFSNLKNIIKQYELLI